MANVPSSPALLEGTVVDARGRPVAGAWVSAWSHFALETPDPAYDVRSDSNGHFRFLTLPDGRYAVTATAPALASGYSGVRDRAARGPLVVMVGGPSQHVEGVVRNETGAPVTDVRIIAAAETENENEVYVTRTDSQGRYVLTLPPGAGYFIVADSAPRPRIFAEAMPRSTTTLDFALDPLPAPRPNDAELKVWLGSAIPFRDGALDAIVGNSTLVGLGEAAHGAAEFPDLRRVAFTSLVGNQGFTVYAMEVGYPDALALDEWISTGKGNVEEAIRGLHTWKDETRETLTLVTWMRAYNADHATKLHVAGFDIYTPSAVPRIVDYLRIVDPKALEAARGSLALFADVGCDSTYPKLPQERRRSVRQDIDALLARFDGQHDSYVARSAEEQWRVVRQLVRIVQQADISYVDESKRDVFMAENVRWLQRSTPGVKVLLDAHVTHLTKSSPPLARTMGSILKEGDYVAIGTTFGVGEILALDATRGRSGMKGTKTFSVDRSVVATFDSALALAGTAPFVIDLRSATGRVAAWLRSPATMHCVRGFFDGHPSETLVPAKAFDAVVYVDRVTAIHPLAPQP